MENVIIASFDPTVFGLHPLSDIKTHSTVKWTTITRDYPRLCTAHLALKVPVVLMSSANIRKFTKAGAWPRQDAIYYDPFVRNYYSPEPNLKTKFDRYINTEPTDEQMVRFFQRMHNIAKNQYKRPSEHTHQPRATPMQFDGDGEEVQGSQIRWGITRTETFPETKTLSFDIAGNSAEPQVQWSMLDEPPTHTTNTQTTQPKTTPTETKSTKTDTKSTAHLTLDEDIRQHLDTLNIVLRNKILDHLQKFPLSKKTTVVQAMGEVMNLSFEMMTSRSADVSTPASKARTIQNELVLKYNHLHKPSTLDESEALFHAAFLQLYPNYYVLDRLVRSAYTDDEFVNLTRALTSSDVLNHIESGDLYSPSLAMSLRDVAFCHILYC